MHSYLLTFRDQYTKHLKDISHNTQNIRSGKLSGRLFETYKNYVRPHGCHIYKLCCIYRYGKMCPCSLKHHGIPHWKSALRCCDKCPGISIPCQERNKDAANTCSKIRFHIY